MKVFYNENNKKVYRNLSDSEEFFNPTDVSKDLASFRRTRTNEDKVIQSSLTHKIKQNKETSVTEFWIRTLSKYGFIPESSIDKLIEVSSENFVKSPVDVNSKEALEDEIVMGIIALSDSVNKRKDLTMQMTQEQLSKSLGDNKINTNSLDSELGKELLNGDINISIGQDNVEYCDDIDNPIIEFVYSLKHKEIYDCIIYKDVYDKLFI